MIKYGMYSAPALRQPPTIHESLASLARAGALAVRVQLDSGRFGIMANYDMLLHGLIANSEEHDHLVVAQDDMVAMGGLHDLLVSAAEHHPERVHALFTPAQNVPNDRDINAWVEINPGWGGWGGCFMFPRSVAMRLVNSEYWRAHMATSRNQADSCTWELLSRLRVPVATHVPSLMDHIGANSTVGHAHGDDTRGFRFNEWP